MNDLYFDLTKLRNHEDRLDSTALIDTVYRSSPRIMLETQKAPFRSEVILGDTSESVRFKPIVEPKRVSLPPRLPERKVEFKDLLRGGSVNSRPHPVKPTSSTTPVNPFMSKSAVSVSTSSNPIRARMSVSRPVSEPSTPIITRQWFSQPSTPSQNVRSASKPLKSQPRARVASTPTYHITSTPKATSTPTFKAPSISGSGRFQPPIMSAVRAQSIRQSFGDENMPALSISLKEEPKGQTASQLSNALKLNMSAHLLKNQNQQLAFFNEAVHKVNERRQSSPTISLGSNTACPDAWLPNHICNDFCFQYLINV